MGRLDKIPDLFANKCHTRKGGHPSEINAGDKATVTLKDDLRAVLSMVNANDGRTAKDIGEYAALREYGGLVVNCVNISEIITLAELPHKKMHKLVELGLVRIEERPGGNLNWITKLGKNQLLTPATPGKGE